MVEDIKLKEIEMEEFKEEAYTHYIKIFPKEERKSLKAIEIAHKKGYTKIIKVLYKNEFVGFMILNRIKEKGYIVLDYFAILPQFRNSQIGTKALRKLIEEEKENSGIFIEIEKPGLGENEEENLIRQKRSKFYENVGFRKLDFDLDLFNIIYTPCLFSNIENNETLIISEILEIYDVMCGKERARKNCRIIKTK